MIHSHVYNFAHSLTAEQLACVRDERRVFEHISFTLNAGDILAVRGDNGAGKSSLLRMLAGMLPIADGHVHWNMDAVYTPPRHCHFIGHDNGFKPQLTLDTNLRFAAALMGTRLMPQQLADLRASIGLKTQGELRFATFSAGQKRRAVLARLLLAARPLWLLDEPHAALDIAGQKLLDDMIETHLARNGMVIIATHMPLNFNAQHVNLVASIPRKYAER